MALVSIPLPGAYVEAEDSNTHRPGWAEGHAWGLRIETLGRCDSGGPRLGKGPATTLWEDMENTEIGD
ncbi:MAG: hypothetical protein HW404_2362 [Anaerolineales bacterium]|nr:hypothetical protein [Anaerolineales bacterium]